MSNGKILVDLDGTLAKYDGWKSTGHIGDPIPSMVEVVKHFIKNGFTVEIFTARMSDPDSRARMKCREAVLAWTQKHIGVALHPTCVKDFSAIAIIDDRAIRAPFNQGLTIDEVMKQMRI